MRISHAIATGGAIVGLVYHSHPPIAPKSHNLFYTDQSLGTPKPTVTQSAVSTSHLVALDILHQAMHIALHQNIRRAIKMAHKEVHLVKAAFNFFSL